MDDTGPFFIETKSDGSEFAGPSIARQCLNAEILDAVRVSLVPYLIGHGIPYFAGLEGTPVKLGQPMVVEGKGVTHLYYEVER